MKFQDPSMHSFKDIEGNNSAVSDMSFADNLCKHFGPRSGPTKCRAGVKPLATESLMEFLKEFSEKVGLGKIPTDGKKHKKLPCSMQKVKKYDRQKL